MNKSNNHWDQFALLLIDVQNDFWSQQMAKIYPDFPRNITTLLNFCRSENIEVIHLRASFKADMSDWMPKYILRERIPCVQGTGGDEVLPFAKENAGEKVIYKQTFDGFQNPELFQYLKQKNKRFVLTAGLVTSTCVLFTTTSAMQKGFLTAVIDDCCADDETGHTYTLDWYRFIFDRTPVKMINDQYPKWLDELRNLKEEHSTSIG
jgi:nicotinamidase-related amidase